MTIFPAVFSAVGLLLIGLAVPLIRRRVKPNSLYGIRVNATFADEWVWYEANARSGRDMAILGAIQLVIAVSLSLLPIKEMNYVLFNAAFLAAGSITFGIVAWHRANVLLKSRRRSA
jgi:uncharacterized membrane protein